MEELKEKWYKEVESEIEATVKNFEADRIVDASRVSLSTSSRAPDFPALRPLALDYQVFRTAIPLSARKSFIPRIV